MPRKLSAEEVAAYLDSRPGWAVLSTIDSDGFPHSVPLGYFRLDRDVILGVRDGTRKVANIESNPNVSVMVEDGSTMADIRGVMIQGRARVVRESGEALELARAGARARGVPESEWPTAPRPGATYIRVTPVRTLSWDYGNPTSDRG
ncbi:pyridoxamine 5'-phosphate oxidase family protein [Mycobacterium crocinum]|uniref:Pyridoxamine 5'-phosphate oxidase family protein n=1 Tax=Mycolicibacterium crocinum TaxID=388459 RepID=A0ABY3TJ94_9MYCO|nr:pyridoxamine 5'-phosphate oxidase family protein [Mycolicibacterium crocinum]MCV7214783.1 pyridoxamine 5'-phosphate oxidase family protein [Mycolicibacterium crocinum]ULN41535.1 pyridoxamine 5'-phosphate oxidase family protein [Mycolicibacterium crocinum]